MGINKKYFLFVIILLAFLLRFYRLGSYPALNADEAAIGYNAYSLIQTGMDEHGNPWPIHFQSFNDFKPGLYFYLVLPFVKALGLNEWAVRIPGALAGVGTVAVLYYLVKRQFSDEKLALVSSLFLAISPWHIHFSRGGWEVNVATFFITLGIWLFLKALESPKYYLLCVISFVLSLYTYHAARIIVPLLVIGSSLIYRKEIRPNIKAFIISGVIALTLLAPLGFDLTRGEVDSRVAGVGLFADKGPIARINEQRGEHGNYGSLTAKLLHNKVVNYSLAFLENWSQHYWGEFLFLTGDVIQRNRVPETGQMYLFDLIFVVAGLVAIARKSSGKWGLIILWLVVAPFAAALTFQSPHALRAQNMVIPLVIISAFGFVTIIDWLNKVLHRPHLLYTTYFILFLLVGWNFARYLHMYYKHMSKEYPFSSQYGVKDLVSYIREKGGNYDKIIVTDRYDQPYIFFLFYMKYPPAKFQGEHVLTPRDQFGFSTVRNFDKYYFEPIVYDRTRVDNPGSLIVGTPQEIPKEANIVKKIYGSNGYLYFEAVAN